MHPSLSIIFFTTASGAGYGLLALLGPFAAFGALPPDRALGLTGLFAALGLITAGLLCSLFHLGHPERAWRAFSQWKTSWLSREGVMAVLTYPPAGLLFVGWVFLGDTGHVFAVAGVAAAAAAVATVYCTAMIYASLKPIPQWHSAWVPANYLSLALLTGAICLNAVAYPFGAGGDPFAWLLLLAALAAWALKAAYWRHLAARTPATTRETATGLGKFGMVRPLEPPHTNPNYLQKEMVFRVARDHARRLRLLVQVFLFALPAAAAVLQLGIGGNEGNAVGTPLAFAVLLFAGAGVLFERWLFFAEAEHTVGLFYD